MACPAKQISLSLLLLALLSSYTQARDNQLFNKLPSTTNSNVVVPTTTTTNNEDKSPSNYQPDFLPDNENGYGLYGHESGQLPPSGNPSAAIPQYTGSRQSPHKYLPKNYNPVAYVTEPEDINDSVSFNGDEKPSATNPTNYYTGAAEDSYIPRPQEEESAYRSYPSAANVAQDSYTPRPQEQEPTYRSYPAAANSADGYYYGGGSSFNSEPRGTRAYDTGAALYRRERYFNGNAGGFRQHGMSDTRALENGKYFYDVNTDKYSSSHPYESLKAVRPTSYEGGNGNYYGNEENNVNGYRFNGESYDQDREFQPEGNGLP